VKIVSFQQISHYDVIRTIGMMLLSIKALRTMPLSIVPLRIMPFSIRTLGIMTFVMGIPILGIPALSVTYPQHNATRLHKSTSHDNA